MAKPVVVRNHSIVSEPEFHDALIAGLARAARTAGRGSLADAMLISGRGLDKIFAGSTPSAKREWDALNADQSALDEVASLYGVRLVPEGSLCDTDMKAAPALAAALHRIVDAEADGTIDHRELLGMEPELIAAEQRIKALRARITDLRKPRAA